jgi:hypothetical protein
MKSSVFLPALAILACLAAPVSLPAITLDGRLDPEYGPALHVQVNSAFAGDDLRGLLDWSDGSELDALHATVSDGVLYLFFTGNQLSRSNPSDPGFFADHLHLFFDTRPGGQAVLRNDNYNVGDYPGHRVLNALAGLAFDPGFEADWWFSDFPTGDATWGLGPFTLHAWSAELLAGGGGPGGYLGSTSAGPSAGLAGGTNPLGVRVAIDNRNVAGVPGGCVAASGAGVTTGVEWAIPLAALGPPDGCVRLCAFFTYKGGVRMANQVLPSLPAGTCVYLAPSTMDFGAFAGEQWITFCYAGTPAAPSTWGRVKTLYR